MALFKIFNNFNTTAEDQEVMQALQAMSDSIPESINLPDTYHEGYMYFDAKKGMFYIDIQGTGGTSGIRIPVNAWQSALAIKADEATTSDKVAHKLTFGAGGTFVFDGSQDVTVPVYAGEML